MDTIHVLTCMVGFFLSTFSETMNSVELNNDNLLRSNRQLDSLLIILPYIDSFSTKRVR